MRYFACFLLVVFLASFIAIDHVDHVVPKPALHNFEFRKLVLTHTEYLFDLGYSNGTRIQNEEKIRVLYGPAYDSVFMYERDTLVATFKARNYSVFGEVRTYGRKGNLEILEYMEDSIDVNDARASTYHKIFKAIRNGKSESFFPDGKPDSITWYRHGKNDTFEKIWYTNGNLYAYKHKDTQMYFYEDGEPEARSYFTKRGKFDRLYVKYKYWPNGKIQLETYSVDEEGLIPVHIWKYYDEKGRLLRQVNKDKSPYMAGAPPLTVEQISIERLEFPECNLHELLKDSIRNILKKTDVYTPGLYRIKFSLSDWRAELVSVEGPEKYSLEDALKKMFYNLGCYSQPHNFRRGKDFYTLEIYISE
jgi:antitoxin component YwqK of YwqJK toxin-antitoxin module